MISFKVFIVLIFSLANIFAEPHPQDISYTPIVFWHGMGDSCCFPFSLGKIKEDLNKSLPGVYIHSLKIGENLIEDVENGYFMHPDKQIDYACKLISNDTNLANGFNAIGFSQGGQFLRAVIQRCDGIKVKNFISIGGQHQGVYGLPMCASLDNIFCDYIRKLLNHAAYLEWVQNFLTQATYWHDPLHEDEYRNGSTFLADINNEVTINQDYVDRLTRLENFVMIKFTKDQMVQPHESEWFGFYKPGQSSAVESLQESILYKEDRLGLKCMDEAGKLHFMAVDGAHLSFSWAWFVDNIVGKFLSI